LSGTLTNQLYSKKEHNEGGIIVFPNGIFLLMLMPFVEIKLHYKKKPEGIFIKIFLPVFY